MPQTNIKGTPEGQFNNPPLGYYGYGFLDDGTPVKINPDSTTTPLSLSENSPENIIANLGVDVVANLPDVATVNVGDVYVTSDTYKIYTAKDSVSWSIVDLHKGQFVTDTIINVLYQYINNLLLKLKDIRTEVTGTSINFTAPKVFGTATTPETGNITFSQTDAVLGIVQKIYHNDTVEPTFTGVTDVQKVSQGIYVPNALNIIFAEWTENNRVEYWIVQEG